MYFVYASDHVGPVVFFPIETVRIGLKVGGQLYRVILGESDGQQNILLPTPLQLLSNTSNPSKHNG